MSRQEMAGELVGEALDIASGLNGLLELAREAAESGKPIKADMLTALLELTSAIEIKLDDAAGALNANAA